MNKAYKPYKWIVLATSLFLMFGNRLFPQFAGLTETGVSIVCIFIGTLLLLLFVEMGWPLLVSILAFVYCDVWTLQQAISASLGNNIVWFIVLSGIVISLLEETGVIQNVALWFITRPWNKGRPWLLIGSLFLSAFLMGTIVDCTALFLIMMALSEEILDILGYKRGDKFGSLLMMGIMVMVGFSYGVTPIGHPLCIVVIDTFMAVEEISFLQYSLQGYATGAVFFVIIMLLYRFGFNMDTEKIRNFDPTMLRDRIKPIDARGKVGIVAYLCIIIWWMAPSLIQGIFPAVYAKVSALGSIAPLMIALVIFNLIRIDGEPVTKFTASIGRAPWSACLVTAVALMLGSSLTVDSSVTDLLSRLLGNITRGLSPVGLVIIIGLFCTILTNFTGNLVVAMLGATLAVKMISLGGALADCNITAICVTIGITSSCSFATPPAATYSAILADSGWVKLKDQFVQSGLMAIIASVVCSTVGYAIAEFLF